ncbi:MAG: MotA/TolQ/ExbB proton channel family protein [Deltaproteobacteria bacterium]|nr:MotA/TolQ/ExbB proton channel family protein [Deltaproteobacteria bacterium]
MLQFALLGAGWVLWLLVFLSVGIIAITVERAIFLLRDGTDRNVLAKAVNAFLRSGSPGDFREQLDQMRGYEARILSAGLEMTEKGPEAMERAMEGTAIAEKLRMERGLSYLATVGANAPFIGLFGTVLGIIKAFHDLSIDTSNASEAVMAGISEALVATAVGLLVAIPAVVLYNAFTRWVRNRAGRSESLADLVVARVAAEAPPDGR